LHCATKGFHSAFALQQNLFVVCGNKVCWKEGVRMVLKVVYLAGI